MPSTNSAGMLGKGMPDDIAGGYDPVGDMWVSSEDSDTEIKSGCGVRLRIIGVTVGAELVRVECIVDQNTRKGSSPVSVPRGGRGEACLTGGCTFS